MRVGYKAIVEGGKLVNRALPNLHLSCLPRAAKSQSTDAKMDSGY